MSNTWDSRLPARGETPLLMLDRWRKLHDELYDSVTGFDITKVRITCSFGSLIRARLKPCHLFIYPTMQEARLDQDSFPSLVRDYSRSCRYVGSHILWLLTRPTILGEPNARVGTPRCKKHSTRHASGSTYLLPNPAPKYILGPVTNIPIP